MEAWANTIFYLVFLGQILTISVYFPRRILARMEWVLEKHPPETHPKLYPKPKSYYRLGQAAFRWANRIIALLGLAVILAAHYVDGGTWSSDGYLSEAWPAGYALIQFVPFLVLSFVEMGQFKLMREAAKQRRANLQRRSVLSLFSPTLTVLAVAALTAAVVFEYMVAGDDFELVKLAGLLFGNGFMAIVLGWSIFGRKKDPHQVAADRDRVLRAAATSMLSVSIVISLFTLMKTAENAYAINYLDAVGMSLYFQIIAWLGIGHVLKAVNLDDIDFDVYRNGSPAS